MTIGAGETILAADIQAIKDDVDKLTDATKDRVETNETTTSTTFTDLTTSGPSVTVTTGTVALVVVRAQFRTQTAGSLAYMDFAISGATTRAATVDTALASGTDQVLSMSSVTLVTGMTAGSNTFTAKYRGSDGNTAAFLRREIIVFPIGA